MTTLVSVWAHSQRRLVSLLLPATLALVVAACSGTEASSMPEPPESPSSDALKTSSSGAETLSEEAGASDGAASSGGSAPIDLSEPASSEGTKPTDCPKLESALYQLTQSSDPATDAAGMGVQYEAGKVRVIVELNEPESGQLAAYQATIERQVIQTVRVLVPLNNLCVLSDDAAVDFVRVPSNGTAR